MYLNKKKANFLKKSISIWKSENIINQEIAQKLEKSINIIGFDWKKLAKWSFRFAIVCFVIAVGSFVASPIFKKLAEFIYSLFHFGFGRIILSFIVAGAGYYFALKAAAKNSAKVFRNESILFVAVLSTTWFIFEVGHKLDTGSGHFSILILISCLAYAIAGYFYKSKMTWVFALLSFGGWLGAETGYMSGWGAYYLGMNYPISFMLLGLFMVIIAWFLKDNARFKFFFNSTLCVGLLYLFISAWIMSIFGNYGDMDKWYEAKQMELFHWSILFAVFALGAMWLGFKEDIRMLRGFGITFFCINLYTRFFEYFWNGTHKAFFFFILGLSFWFLASKSEAMWIK
jgi:hypothetical protein